MQQTYSLQQKFKQLLVILLPIIVSQITLYLMSFFDTVMSGRSSAYDLAGVAIGSSIWLPIYTGLHGILLAITPLVAQLLGAQRREEIPFIVVQATYLALFISLGIIIVGAALLTPVMDRMSLELPVRAIAQRYLAALAWGIIPLFIYSVLRSFMEALGQTRVTMVITLISLPTNVALNYVLIFGKLGFPRLGGVGAGFASAFTYWFICLIGLCVVVRLEPFASLKVYSRFYSLALPTWKEIFKIGIPTGFAICLETGVFAAVTLLMSSYNTVTIAAHQAAMNFASLLYMLPMSISMALTILVGFEAGARRFKDARQYSYLGLLISLSLAALCALSLLLFNRQVAAMYSNEAVVILLTQQFLIYAIFFQFSDAIGAPIQGALRGYKDVNTTMVMAFIAYWVIGLPLGFMLSRYTGLAAFGYWVGLIVGVLVSAGGLLVRLLWLQRRLQFVIINNNPSCQ